ncbi:MAG: hypothetical protein OXF20_05470 [Gammaproteobacteria bacterium]|nr:hypothetical protein [Gammaproteobacteria bacterium]
MVIRKSYEEFLQKAESLVRKMQGRTSAEEHPSVLNGHPLAAVLFNNLPSIPADSFQFPQDVDKRADLSLEIERVMRESAPAGWKGDDIRERQILNALFPLFNRDSTATEAIFDIIRNQPDEA